MFDLKPFEWFRKAHANADTDNEPSSIHHTLGKGPVQAAKGNHSHADLAALAHLHDAAYAAVGHLHTGVYATAAHLHDAAYAAAAHLHTGVYEPVAATVVKRKLVDEIVNNSIAVQNDDDLFFAVTAGKVYIFEMLVLVTGGTSSTANFKSDFTFPAGVLSWGGLGPAVSLPVGFSSGEAQTKGESEITVSPSAESAYGAENAGIVTSILLKGLFECNTTGTVRYRWAQSTLTAANTQVKAGSFLVAKELA